MNAQQKTKGFTIIEVVLVLAIAGLIFLMVFLALPALQRSQRDTQRKDDLSRFAAATTSYRSNNGGGTPFTFNASGQLSAAPAAMVTAYLTNGGSSFNDPGTNTAYGFTTGAITVDGTDTGVADTVKHIAVYTTNQTTGCAAAPAAANGQKTVAVMYVENGGSICQYL